PPTLSLFFAPRGPVTAAPRPAAVAGGAAPGPWVAPPRRDPTSLQPDPPPAGSHTGAGGGAGEGGGGLRPGGRPLGRHGAADALVCHARAGHLPRAGHLHPDPGRPRRARPPALQDSPPVPPLREHKPAPVET